MRRNHNFIDLTGKKFYRLTVMEEAGRNKHKQILWLCLCDCGNEITVRGKDLLSGNTKSCGCYMRERIIESNKLRVGKNNPNWRGGRKAAVKRWYYKNHEKNKAYYNMKAMERRARKLNQTPADANLKKIQLYYTICSYLNEKAVYYHVDHIHPLSKGGLHEANNLQILDAELNLKKSNKWPLSRAEEIRYKGITI